MGSPKLLEVTLIFLFNLYGPAVVLARSIRLYTEALGEQLCTGALWMTVFTICCERLLVLNISKRMVPIKKR